MPRCSVPRLLTETVCFAVAARRQKQAGITRGDWSSGSKPINERASGLRCGVEYCFTFYRCKRLSAEKYVV